MAELLVGAVRGTPPPTHASLRRLPLLGVGGLFNSRHHAFISPLPPPPSQIYNRSLSDTDRQIVEEYLANKYALFGLGGPHAMLGESLVGPSGATNERLVLHVFRAGTCCLLVYRRLLRWVYCAYWWWLHDLPLHASLLFVFVSVLCLPC